MLSHGIIEFYKVSRIRTHGERHLRRCTFDFSTTHLRNPFAPNLNSPLIEQVKHALEHSLRRAFLVLRTVLYLINLGRKEQLKNDLLLRFAKWTLTCQMLHKQGKLLEVSRWWKDLDFDNTSI
ncbi:hypothetical protein HAX54_044501 [Datura stramonium]|uniref:Uncharacterized protein n=1 Tax=Datura stramonium TaxID=4076 RepID=A0ABS8SPI6_DATST|nr:hypothetical protein [Datura stramonium]